MVLVLDMPKKRLQEGFNLHVDVSMYVNYQTKFKTLFDSTFTKYKPMYRNNIVMFNDADCILLYQTLYYINRLVLKANPHEMLDFKESFISKVVNRLSKITPSYNKSAFNRDFDLVKYLPEMFYSVFPELVTKENNSDFILTPEIQAPSEPVQVSDSETQISETQVSETQVSETQVSETQVSEPQVSETQVSEPVQISESVSETHSESNNESVEKITKTLEMNIKRALNDNATFIERTLNNNLSAVIEKVLNDNLSTMMKKTLNEHLNTVMEKVLNDNLSSVVEKVLNENLNTVMEKVFNENLNTVMEKVLNDNLSSVVEKVLNDNLGSVVDDKFSKLEEQLISSIIENLEANIVENLEEKFNAITSSTTESSEVLALLCELKEKINDDDVDDKSKAKLSILEMENSELRRENEEVFEKLNECEIQFNAIKEKYKTLQQIKRKYKTMVLNGANINHIEHIQNDDHRTRKNFVSPIPNEPYREYYKK
jgi:hypothetical protein